MGGFRPIGGGVAADRTNELSQPDRAHGGGSTRLLIRATTHLGHHDQIDRGRAASLHSRFQLSVASLKGSISMFLRNLASDEMVGRSSCEIPRMSFLQSIAPHAVFDAEQAIEGLNQPERDNSRVF